MAGKNPDPWWCLPVNNDIWVIEKLQEYYCCILYPENPPVSHQNFQKSLKGKNSADAGPLHQSDSGTVWISSRTEGVITVNLPLGFEYAGATGNGYSLKSQFVLSFYQQAKELPGLA